MARRSRLALVNCESGDGPWYHVRGDEHGIEVTGLRDGERVWLRGEGVVGSTGFLPIYYTQPGSYRIDLAGVSRFRFTKEYDSGVQPSKTCVEVLTNG